MKPLSKTLLITSVFTVVLLGCLSSCFEQRQETTASIFNQSLPDRVDFNFHIKPILSDRCFTCHGPDANTREAGLRLDTKEGAFAALGDDKDHYAIISGDVENSTLIQRIFSDNPDDIMPTPESNLTLTDFEKKLLKKWVEQGAEWKEHWSFLPIKKAEIPQVSEGQINNPIDNFVLAKLETQGLKSLGQASKENLIRRVSFDLTGLPPTLEEIDDFINDNSPNAYEKVVDRLLETDAYAETMATRWLDLARYADSHGYQDDLERIMFPWRDWVIHAFKKNMPYNEFVTWQLAGDLLPNPTREQIIATAFNRNHKITQEGGVIPEEYRVEYVSDRTQTFGTAFLGLTFECAKCHDHKYDALSQKDYFSLFSFFNNVPEEGLIEPYGAIPKPYITLTKEEIEEQLQFIKNLDELDSIPLMVMEEMPQKRQAYILKRGAYDKPSTPVDPDLPKSILPFDESLSKDRLGLSRWLFSKDNPLTARVTVNRLWQQCFGKGIVATPDDFGNQGSLPTHPELLDWLALEFMENDWDQKAILKTIVMSATYQQTSRTTEKLNEIDPENNLLAHAPRLRLSAEMIRDHALASSGLLERTLGGPSVKPYQPDGLWAETIGGGGGSLAQYVQDEGSKIYRRSIYTFWKRTVPPPSMMTFDATSRDICAVKRQTTSTPLQALVMLNDPQIVEASRVLAYRTIEQQQAVEDRIAMMFRLATSRNITEDELENLVSYFEEEKSRFESTPADALALLEVGKYPQKELISVPEMAAYTIVANAIFNLDETITRG
ncbi:MAG: PSD1 and planctomycete cytochrome C domain-containing protein [Chitinophagales bacterium]|nr:PSD1 and planctomycete cytochrome C domain-containing protein [Chitinophagales bacterium]